jgi:hypothetical protein
MASIVARTHASLLRTTDARHDELSLPALIEEIEAREWIHRQCHSQVGQRGGQLASLAPVVLDGNRDPSGA